MKPNVYINLSGGIDSTYYLWRWLQEKKGDIVQVHHVLLHKIRREVELQATKNILEWLKKNVSDRFVYVESTYAKGTIKRYMMDVEIMGALSGFAVEKSVHTVLLPYCYEETPIVRKHLENGGIERMDMKHRTAMFMGLMNMGARKKFRYIAPYAYVRKRQMIEELPLELLEMTWFCRRPKMGKPCTRCFNCKRVLPHLNKKRNGQQQSKATASL